MAAMPAGQRAHTPSAYILWQAEEREKIGALGFVEMGKELGRRWGLLSARRRQPWLEKAAAAKQAVRLPPLPEEGRLDDLAETLVSSIAAARTGRRRRATAANWEYAGSLVPELGEKLSGKVRASSLGTRLMVERELVARGIRGWVRGGRPHATSWTDLKAILHAQATFKLREVRYLTGGRKSPDLTDLTPAELRESDERLWAEMDAQADADGADDGSDSAPDSSDARCQPIARALLAMLLLPFLKTCHKHRFQRGLPTRLPRETRRGGDRATSGSVPAAAASAQADGGVGGGGAADLPVRRSARNVR